MQMCDTVLPLYLSEKDPRYPFNRTMSGTQNRSKRYGEEGSLVALPGIEPRFLSLHPVA